MTETFYSGPGKVYVLNPGWTAPGTVSPAVVGLQPEGTNGSIKVVINQDTVTRGAAQFGDLLEQMVDQTGKISLTPFDNWSLISVMFPPYLGVTSTAGTGLLQVGISPFDPAASGASFYCGVYASDTSQYNFVRCGLTKHPTMKLGAGEKLFGEIEYTALLQLVLAGANVYPGSPSSGAFMSTTQAGTGAPITESGATDPDTTGFTTSDFAQTHWSGAWGAVSGFTNMEGEQGFDLVPDVAYSTFKVQGLTRIMKLTKARFMVKFRPVGPTATQLLSKALGVASGAIMTGSSLSGGAITDLVLTGSNSKTVTLKNAIPKGAGYTFGGTTLRNDEIGFVQQIPVTASAAAPSLIFSA